MTAAEDTTTASPLPETAREKEETMPETEEDSVEAGDKNNDTAVTEDVPLGEDNNEEDDEDAEFYNSFLEREAMRTGQDNNDEEEEDDFCYGPLEREAMRMARWPKTYFWVCLILTVASSGLGLYYGEFAIDADSSGWLSRGTVIANRQMQMEIVRRNKWDLRSDNEQVWEELTTQQQEWFFEDIELRRRRLSAASTSATSAATINPFASIKDYAAKAEAEEPRSLFIQQPSSSSSPSLEFLERRLQQDNSTIWDRCNVNTYLDHRFPGVARLWPIWRTKKAGGSALDPDVLHDLCVAEENTQKVLMEHNLCYGCKDGGCLPPYSIVTYVRFVVIGGFDMDCQTLANAWAPQQDLMEDKWTECVAHLKSTPQYERDDRGPCPLMFTGALVDPMFDVTGLVQYTSSIFVTEPYRIDRLWEVSDQFDRGSALIEGVYDTQFEDFALKYTDEIINSDIQLAVWSALITALAMLVHTRSPFLTLIGIIEITFSFPVAFVVYRFFFQITFFPFLNFIGIFVVFALGADHIFVAVDKWKNARLDFPDATTEEVAARSLPMAARAMALTTITTAVAFWATAITPVAPVKVFALFSGLLIVFDYILDILLLFPCLIIYDSYRFQTNYLVDLTCCSNKKSNRTDNDVEVSPFCDSRARGSTGDERGASPQRRRRSSVDEMSESQIHLRRSSIFDEMGNSQRRRRSSVLDDMGKSQKVDDVGEDPPLIRQIMFKYYDAIHCIRKPLLLASMGALALCAYYSTKLEPPVSADVRVLNPTVEYEKAHLWRSNLLYDLLDKQRGWLGFIVWGVDPVDNGDRKDPDRLSSLVLDESFDPSTEAAQIYLRDFCDDLVNQTFVYGGDKLQCAINMFDSWLQKHSGRVSRNETPAVGDIEYILFCQGATGLPMSEEAFHPCLSAWVELTNKPEILVRDGVVEIIFVDYRSRVRFDTPFDTLDAEWKLQEDWMREQNRKAPEGLSSGFGSSLAFWWYDTNNSLSKSAIDGASIAISAAALVIFLYSRSITLTVFSIISIGYILTSVTASMVAAGWELGFIESICFAILVGVSVDFVIHFSHAYTEMAGNVERGLRTKFALVTFGPSILAAGFTTLTGAIVMLFTVTLAFQLFAFVLVFTVIQSTIGSFVVLLSLTDCIGPSNPTQAWDSVCAKLSRKDDSERQQGEGNLSEENASPPPPIAQSNSSCSSASPPDPKVQSISSCSSRNPDQVYEAVVEC